MKTTLALCHVLLFSVILQAQPPSRSIYVNDMDYVLGDVKQGFITNRITTEDQVENLIIGFKTMNVNGIRIPIFADGFLPNPTIFDYFYQRIVAEGFKIFANPAQSSGGQRIACGMLNGPLCPTYSNGTRRVALENRIKDFAATYSCDWINPFNEDGAPGAAWSADQITAIYRSLHNNLNGAELIGPGVWGIPASVAVLEKTKVAEYVSIATSHNLGYHHESWPAFRAVANTYNLPIWDSEVNDFDEKGKGTRLEAAIQAKVDGLVLYNSWNMIDKTSGTVNGIGQRMMNQYLKFRTDRKYYIDCMGTNKRLAADGTNENPYGAAIQTTGSKVEWRFVAKGNGYYHIELAAGGNKPRLRSDNTSFAHMQSTTFNGMQTYFDFTEGSAEDSYHITLPDLGEMAKRRLQITKDGAVKMVSTSNQGSWVSFRFTPVTHFLSTATTHTTTTTNREKSDTKLQFPTHVKASLSEFGPLNMSENKHNYGLKIYNLSGQLVFQTQNIEEFWSPSGRQKGVFLFQVSYQNKQNANRIKNGKVFVF